MKKVLTLVLALVLALGVTAVAWATGEETGEAKPVEVRSDYHAQAVGSYATIAEAARNLGENKWIVIVGDYTLGGDFAIPDGVSLDVANNVTLTVQSGVTLTVRAEATRLGVRPKAVVVNNGTIMVQGKVTVFNEGVLDIDGLTLPEGYVLDKSGSSYLASKAFYKITYSDNTAKLVGQLSSSVLNGAKSAKLLDNITDFAGSFSLVDKLAEDFVFDLGGFTLSGKSTASTPVLKTSVPMTIQNGTIKYMSSNAGGGAMMTSADVVIAGDAVIDGGAGYGIWTDGYDGHTLTVNGMVKSDGYYAITSNGSENGGLIAECNIVVNEGAKIEAKNGIAIYHPEMGTVTVNGGDISGHTGIEMCAGKLVVKGGSITSSGANMNATGSQNAILDGGAISIIDRNYPGGTPTMEISGGTVRATGTGALAVKAYDYKDNEVKAWTNAAESVKISGGTFSNDPRAYVEAQPVATVGGDYIVGGKDIADAANGGKNVTIVKGGTIDGVKEGVTIAIGEEAGTVIINNKTVRGDSYTVPITPRYYYNSTTTDTKKDDGKSSPKTFDVGVGAYAVSAVLSLTGMAYVGKKKF